MCLGLAYRQTLQGRTVFISYSGRVSLAESLCYRYALNGGANLSTWATKVHCGASALLGSVCNRAICHTAALHASMHPKPAQANSSAKGLLAPVWIDCDAGSDDALGILVAARANIVGISSVRGNTAAEQVSKNVLRVLSLCSRQEVPVFTGADISLNGQQQPLPEWSGQDGLNDQPDVVPSSASVTAKPASGKASQKLVEAAQSHAGSLTVIASGPLTNLAHALQLDPQFVTNVQRLVIMGGNESYNESTSTGAEFNFYCDPDAADLVIRKFSGKATLLTWECMQNNALPGSIATKVAAKDTQRARFITAICGLNRTDKDSEHKWVPCDPLAFAVALSRSIILAANSVHCKVETQAADRRGQTSFADQVTDTALPEDQGGVVCKVNKVDTARFAEAITHCIDATND
ncbi:hypothetical protein ABBQ38_006128 [Trebouxia sp. C0009 RCD-2024]